MRIGRICYPGLGGGALLSRIAARNERARPMALQAAVSSTAIGAVTVSAWAGTWIPVVLLLGAICVVALVCRPMLAVVVLLLTWAGPVDPTLLSRSVGGLRIGLADVALGLGLIGVVAARILRRGSVRTLRSPRFALVTLAYLAVVAYALMVGHHAGDTRGQAASAWMASCAVLAYFLLRDVFAGRPKRFAELLVVVTGTCSLLVASAALFHIPVLTGRTIGYVITEGQLSSATRLDPPLLRLLSITVLMATVGGVLSGRSRMLRLVLIAGMLTVEAFSFTRSTWIPLIAVAVFLPVLISRRPVAAALAVRTVAAALVLAVVVAASTSGALGPTAQTIGTRLFSAAQRDVFDETSLWLRLYENQAAIDTIKQHPVAGVGLPRPYGTFTISGQDSATGDNIFVPQRFIHNVYLGIWAWMGLPGVLVLLCTCVAAVNAFLAVLRGREYDRRPAVACFGGLLVLAASSTFQTNLLYQPALFAIAIGLAYLDVWLGARAQGSGWVFRSGHGALDVRAAPSFR
jgi:O-antigen ligase